MIDLVSVGRKISTLRSQKNLSQDRLAETLLVSRQAVSAWETGKAAPSIDNVIELAKIFGVSFEEILCLGEKPVLNPDNPFDGHGDYAAEMDREEEGFRIAEFDLSNIAEERQNWGVYRDRRVDLYGDLVHLDLSKK